MLRPVEARLFGLNGARGVSGQTLPGVCRGTAVCRATGAWRLGRAVWVGRLLWEFAEEQRFAEQRGAWRLGRAGRAFLRSMGRGKSVLAALARVGLLCDLKATGEVHPVTRGRCRS